LDQDGAARDGDVQLEESDGSVAISHMHSYFQYSGYNLLNKFLASRELIGLEKLFSKMRMLDVSKCFFNIYTHSIGWAVRDKAFSKKYRNMYSFSTRFDELMQHSNYNETNGIVVGPELSRIFAEIILQSVDVSVMSTMQKEGLRHNHDYAVRRYVDDFFVFANSDQVLSRIATAISVELERFKLFVNDNKEGTLSRPFVTNISLARREIAQRVLELRIAPTPPGESAEVTALVRTARQAIQDIRYTISRYDIGFNNISGWLLAILRRILGHLATLLPHEGQAEIVTALREVISLIGYVISMDLRVRTTYTLCQIAAQLQRVCEKLGNDGADQILYALANEAETLLQITVGRDPVIGGHDESIELYNILICGSNFIGPPFLKRQSVIRALYELSSGVELTYFQFVVTKFCYLRDASAFASDLERLNKIARAQLLRDKDLASVRADVFMMIADYASAPDLDPAERRRFWRAIHGDCDDKLVDRIVRYVGLSIGQGRGRNTSSGVKSCGQCTARVFTRLGVVALLKLT